MFKYISIGVSLLWVSVMDAQQIPFVSYTQKDGLANNRVKKMIQDKKGQLYFLTNDGLSIYDGTGFVNFTTAEGLPSEIVNDAMEMGNDSVWIATNAREMNYLARGKLQRFKTADGFCPIINSFYKNAAGEIFAVSDDGLFRFTGNRFVKLPLFKDEKDNKDEFLNIICQSGGFMLIITDPLVGKNKASILLYDIATGTIIQKISGITGTLNAAIDNDIWLASPKGLMIIDKEQLEQGKIIFKRLPALLATYKNEQCSFVFYDNYKNLWIARSDKGLLRIDKTGVTKHFGMENGLLSNSLTGIFQDKENTLWFIHYNGGVQKLVFNNVEMIQRPFGYTIQSMTTNITGDSVYYWDIWHKKMILQTSEGINISSLSGPGYDIGNLAVTGKDLYLNGSNHIYHLPVSQLTQKKFTPALIYTHDSGSNLFRSVVDANGIVTVQGDNHLVSIIKPATICRTPIEFFTDEGTLDSKGRLWFASRAEELYVINTKLSDPHHYLEVQKNFKNDIQVRFPRSVTTDKPGNVWVGTREDGLYCFHINDQMQISLLKHFTKKDGLPANFITYLYGDRAGSVWAGTSAGISKIIWKNDDCVVDNLSQRANLYPFIITIHEDDRQNILALTSDGSVMRIAMAEDSSQGFIPQLYIKSIKAGDELIPATKMTGSFSYRQSDISVMLASPSFYDEKQTKFSYMLITNGHSSEKWSEPSANGLLNFINLLPGTYHLLIKASYSASRYPEQLTDYTFIINPPWWQTWWFRILAGFTFLAIFVLLARAYYNRKLTKQKIVLEKQQAIQEDRSRIAKDIHDDLGAGLSTIRFLSEKVIRNSFGDATKKDAEKIVASSNELVQKMNELIWAMNEKNDTLEDLLFYARSYAAEYGEEHNLEMDINLPEIIPQIMVTGEVRRNVFLTLKEGLHNIVKHAAAKHVFINIETGSSLLMSIRDDGIGFEMKDGDGNGLKNMKKRMESIAGNFEIISEGGTTVKICVPLT